MSYVRQGIDYFGRYPDKSTGKDHQLGFLFLINVNFVFHFLMLGSNDIKSLIKAQEKQY